MSEHPTRYRLPVHYSTQIGRIITRWAYLEWQLQETVYLLLSVSPKQGRIAVREPRIADYPKMLKDLAHLKSITISEDMKTFGKLLKETESYRNRLAHGVWLEHSATKTPVLRDLSGAYVRTAGNRTAHPRIKPLAVQVRKEHLKDILTAINSLNGRVQHIQAEIQEQLQP